MRCLLKVYSGRGTMLQVHNSRYQCDVKVIEIRQATPATPHAPVVRHRTSFKTPQRGFKRRRSMPTPRMRKLFRSSISFGGHSRAIRWGGRRQPMSRASRTTTTRRPVREVQTTWPWVMQNRRFTVGLQFPQKQDVRARQEEIFQSEYGY